MTQPPYWQKPAPRRTRYVKVASKSLQSLVCKKRQRRSARQTSTVHSLWSWAESHAASQHASCFTQWNGTLEIPVDQVQYNGAACSTFQPSTNQHDMWGLRLDLQFSGSRSRFLMPRCLNHSVKSCDRDYYHAAVPPVYQVEPINFTINPDS